MIKTLSRLICALFLLTVATNGMAQSKPKSQAAKPAKSAAKPVEKKEEVQEDTPPPVVEELENTTSPAPALPPLPEIDTVAAPNDDLTIEIKKLLAITNSMNTATVVMKETINSQRKMKAAPIPEEFYDRFIGAIDNGQVGRMLENVVIKIYRQKFNKDEVSQIIKFYETPVGKKLAAEMVPIASASRAAGEKIGQYVALKIIDDMMKEGKWK
jgi:uncharacterized protein